MDMLWLAQSCLHGGEGSGNEIVIGFALYILYISFMKIMDDIMARPNTLMKFAKFTFCLIYNLLNFCHV